MSQPPQLLHQQNSSSLSLPSGNYIYSLASCGGTTGDSLAAISSDDSLRLFDRRTLQLRGSASGFADNVHEGGVTCLCDGGDGGGGGGGGGGQAGGNGGGNNHLLVTGGRDGRMKLWDIRGEGKKAVVEFQTEKNAPVLSIASNAGTNTVVAGTELVSSQATVAFWDTRSPKQPRLQYSESHNDDVTELQFHPTNPSTLLSGSTDGLVNIYDTTITDEDDALLQVVNHGSVHHAGFLAEDNNSNDNNGSGSSGAAGAIYALSHDENFSIYPRHSSEEDATEPPPIPFGDLRPVLDCSYVVQVLRGSGESFVAAGSTSEQRLDLIPLTSSPKWNFNQDAIWRLPGGHGEEIVRSIYLDQQSNSVFTCGEDGFVRVWTADNDSKIGSEDMSTVSSTKTPRSKEKKSKKEKRYKPY
ncbi:hypothetical protein FQN54_000180 [Arachnomyces sp. PD_36]|nr:hypothetical protein FQN54_000180 [Arachnomyces sp. PD_36]